MGFKAEPVIGAEGEEVIDARGKVVTTGERVIDPEHEPTVARMFALTVQGATPGEISRTLNAAGATTIRGLPWTTRALRDVLRNEDHAGRNGYPQLIEHSKTPSLTTLLRRNAEAEAKLLTPPRSSVHKPQQVRRSCVSMRADS